MKDEVLMAEEFGRLKAELGSAETDMINKDEQIASLEKDVIKAKTLAWFKNSWIILSIFLGSLLLLFCAGYPIVMVLTTSSNPTHCKIIQTHDKCNYEYIIVPSDKTDCHAIKKRNTCSYVYKVKGVVPWGSDIEFGTFDSQEEALNHAAKNNCRIGD